MKDTQPPPQIQEHSLALQIINIEKAKYPLHPVQIKDITQNENITGARKEQYLSEVSEYKSVCNSDIKEKERKRNKQKEKNYSNSFQCNKCDKKYTWYSGLANHKRFVHNNKREK